MLSQSDVRRVDYGFFVRPAGEGGRTRPWFEPAVGYAVSHPRGLLLFDTGIGVGDPEIEAHFAPRRSGLAIALARAGTSASQVRFVVNCHLHFDHCGGNPMLMDRPIFVQRAELRAARTPDYTMPSLIDFPGARYEELDGETELFPDVWLIPTPGHTAGHQSLVVRCSDGTLIAAGQAHHFAADYTSDLFASRHEGTLANPWLERLQAFDPARVLFAHDLAVWEPASG